VQSNLTPVDTHLADERERAEAFDEES